MVPPWPCLNAWGYHAELAFACEELLGWDAPRTFSLLTGLSNTSTEPGTKLAELAALAAASPDLRALLRNPDSSTYESVRATDPAFADAFDAYQDAYAYRALRYDVCDPTLLEVPHLTLGLIRDQIDRRFDPATDADAAQKKRSATLAEARAALAGRPALERERFEKALERARTYYPIREDNEFYTVSGPTALMRFLLLELGRRMAARGQFDQRDDIFMIEAEEALPAFMAASDCHELVARRRAERAWAMAHPAPPSYGRDPGPPPDFSVFPKEAADGMKAIFWSLERVFENDRSQQHQRSASSLKGIAAAPGHYTGPARIVLSEEEFDKIQPGDVLVCPITSPVWSVLFPSIGALVTDTGGILSHPAIIAREYGIPAVVAAGNATALLRDGQMVTVDGDRGTVTAVS